MLPCLSEISKQIYCLILCDVRFKNLKIEFEKWDDYIEWKAYVDTLRYLERKLRDVDNAKDIRIA